MKLGRDGDVGNFAEQVHRGRTFYPSKGEELSGESSREVDSFVYLGSAATPVGRITGRRS